MAGNFDSTIREVMNSTQSKKPKMDPGDTPAEEAQDRARGIAPGSPQDQRLDAAHLATRRSPTPAATAAQVTSQAGLPPHHVAAAAGIAHAILGNKGIR